MQNDYAQIPLIKDDAIFIADAHFMPLHTDLTHQSKVSSQALLEYFEHLLNNIQTIPSQIFLMGDIAHLLLGKIPSSIQSNKGLLNAIQSLSQYTQIWWFEGNHDFKLTGLTSLSSVRIIPRSQQPKLFYTMHQAQKKHLLLAHGDIFLNTKYELYIRLMNTQILNAIMYALDTLSRGRVYRSIIAKVNANTIKQGRSDDIHTFAQSRIQAYNAYMQKVLKNAQNITLDAIIEGHFHIGKTCKGETLYVSLPSFYISRSICDIKSLFT